MQLLGLNSSSPGTPTVSVEFPVNGRDWLCAKGRVWRSGCPGCFAGWVRHGVGGGGKDWRNFSARTGWMAYLKPSAL